MDVVNWLRNESGLNLRQAYVVEHVLVMLDNVHRLDPCAADLMWFELYKQLDGIFGQNVQSIRINPINGKLLHFLSFITLFFFLSYFSSTNCLSILF